MSQHRRRKRPKCQGAATIILVVTLGVLACALLSLCGQTAMQSQAAQRVAMEQKQCDALLELGQEILIRRLQSNPEYPGESFQVQLPWSVQKTDMQIPFKGSVSIEKSTATSDHREWRISVSCGLEGGTPFESARSIHSPSNPNPVSTPGNIE